MKSHCEKCNDTLADDGEAYICSFECTFCSDCGMELRRTCPHCGGELVLRPRRRVSVRGREAGPGRQPPTKGQLPTIGAGLVWAASLGVWSLVGLAATVTIYELYHLTGGQMGLGTVAGMEFSQILAYAPISPIAFALAIRYPIERHNWMRRIMLHLAFGILFTLGHITLRGVTPYGYWDRSNREWSSAFWNSHLHTFRNPWTTLRGTFLENLVDDLTGVYLPIGLVAHLIAYYQRLREKQIRATELEGQLAKARLQTLKSQLQPHFLFNTLHSISALMMTDVAAADQMMTSLSDLLRMSLDANGIQTTTLAREIEFVGVYLDIEKARFQDRLAVYVDIAPECLDAIVPHLLLQPLVENAVRHGVSRRSLSGEIRIVAKHEGSDLHLWVRDNGPGVAEALLHRAKHGLGLRLTKERLSALYGGEQSCEIRNREEGGAEVRLRIPFAVSEMGFS